MSKDLVTTMEYLYWLGEQEEALLRNLESFNGGDYDVEIIREVERELRIVRELKEIVRGYTGK